MNKEPIQSTNFLVVNIIHLIFDVKVLNEVSYLKIYKNCIKMLDVIPLDMEKTDTNTVFNLINKINRIGKDVFSRGCIPEDKKENRIYKFFYKRYKARIEQISQFTFDVFDAMFRFIFEYEISCVEDKSGKTPDLLKFLFLNVALMHKEINIFDAYAIQQILASGYIQIKKNIVQDIRSGDEESPNHMTKDRIVHALVERFYKTNNSQNSIIKILYDEEKSNDGIKLLSRNWEHMVRTAILVFYLFSYYKKMKVNQKEIEMLDGFSKTVIINIKKDFHERKDYEALWLRNEFTDQYSKELILLFLFFSPGNSQRIINDFFSSSKLNRRTFDAKKMVFEKLFKKVWFSTL